MTYSTRNLKELESFGTQVRMPPGMEARFGREALGCENVGFSYQRYAPASGRSPTATTCRRVVVIVSGGGRI